jgi:hypothetical protein
MKSGRKSPHQVIAFSPLSKPGEFSPVLQYWADGSVSSETEDSEAELPSKTLPAKSAEFEPTSVRPPFTATEMRHSFAIETLGKPARFHPRPYRYTCVRCKWMFRINDSFGSTICLDSLGNRLPESEQHKRAVTFARGPCSAFPQVNRLVTQSLEVFGLSHYFWKVVVLLWRPTNGGNFSCADRRPRSVDSIAPGHLTSTKPKLMKVGNA